MWWIFLAMVVIFGGLGSVIVAMMYMAQKRKTIESLPTITIRAEVIAQGAKQQHHSFSIEDPYKLGASIQSIVFLTDNNQYIQLNVSSKDYNRLLPGWYGDLTYQANNMTSFIRKKGHEEQRLKDREEERLSTIDTSGGIPFYCEALFLNRVIPTSDPVPYSLESVVDYIKEIQKRPSEQFFGLDNGYYVIQFSSSTDTDIILDIPDVQNGGSLQASINDFDEVLHIVSAYYKNQDVRTMLDFEFIKW